MKHSRHSRGARRPVFAGSLMLAVLFIPGPATWAVDHDAPALFRDDFAGRRLGSAWSLDLAEGNAAEVRDGALEFRAHQNTYAHVERPLGIDLVRAQATLKAADGHSWATSLFLYWDERNWCQLTVLKAETGSVGVWYQLKGGGQYLAVETVDGETTEYRLAPTYHPRWHTLAIELGEDCVRYESSGDGRTWASLRVAQRPARWRGKAPERLIVGKGFSSASSTPPLLAPDLDNSYAERGPRTVSKVRDVSVMRTPRAHLRMTALEKRQLEEWGRDLLGEEELAREGDPTFESVSGHFPGLLFPRELIGLKDHPEDIGVGFDGSLQLKNELKGDHFDTGIAAAAWEAGTPPERLGWQLGSCRKRLLHGYMPIVISEYESGGLEFTQTAFGRARGLRLDAPMFACSRMTVRNPGREVAVCPLRLRLQPTSKSVSWTLRIPPGGEESVYAEVPYSADPSQLRAIDR